MNVEDRCDELIRTLPFQSARSFLGFLTFGAVLFAYGLATLSQLPPRPSGWTVGLGVTSAVLGAGLLGFIGTLYLDRRFRRKTFREMLSGEALAHWTYTDEEWESYIRHQRRRMKENSPITGETVFAWLFIGGLFAGITAIVSWNWGEHRWPAIGIAFVSGVVFIAVMSLFEWIGWHFWCRGLRNRRGEAFVMPNAVYFHSRMHGWGHYGGRLQSVTHDTPAKLPISILKFEIAVLVRNGEHVHELEVPVPGEKREEADKVIDFYKN